MTTSFWDETALDVALTPDGATALVAGTVARPKGYLEAVVIAVDVATGEELWRAAQRVKRHDAIPNAVAIAQDGSTAYVTGFVDERRGRFLLDTDILTFAVDVASGAELWSRISGGNRGDHSYDVEVSPDGSRVYLTGSDRGSRWRTEALDATDGRRIWRTSFTGPEGQSAYATELSLAPDGSSVYVTGFREGEDVGGAALVTAGYDAATGLELWVSEFDGSGSGWDVGLAIDVAPDGSMVFAGGESDGDWALLACDAVP